MKKSSNYVKLAQTALLSAVIILMAFTPVGFLKTPFAEITFIPIPATIGAILMGPAMGAYFGALFGIVSFIQCFGFSAFGVALFAVDPWLTFALCMIPRVVMGVGTALIYKALKKWNITALAVSSLVGPVLNTAIFVGFLMPFFGGSDFIQGLMALFNTTDAATFLVACFAVNGAVEAIVCGIASFAVVKVLTKVVNR